MKRYTQFSNEEDMLRAFHALHSIDVLLMSDEEKIEIYLNKKLIRDGEMFFEANIFFKYYDRDFYEKYKLIFT